MNDLKNDFNFKWMVLIVLVLMGCMNGATLQGPENLTASDGDFPEFIELRWEPIADALYYNIYRSVSPEGEKELINECSSSYFRDYGVSSGVIYFYQVSAIYLELGESSRSITDPGLLPIVVDQTPAGPENTEDWYEQSTATGSSYMISWQSSAAVDVSVYHTDKQTLYLTSVVDSTSISFEAEEESVFIKVIVEDPEASYTIQCVPLFF